MLPPEEGCPDGDMDVDGDGTDVLVAQRGTNDPTGQVQLVLDNYPMPASGQGAMNGVAEPATTVSVFGVLACQQALIRRR